VDETSVSCYIYHKLLGHEVKDIKLMSNFCMFVCTYAHMYVCLLTLKCTHISYSVIVEPLISLN